MYPVSIKVESAPSKVKLVVLVVFHATFITEANVTVDVPKSRDLTLLLEELTLP